MAANGNFRENSLHPSVDHDSQGVVRRQAVRREQPEALFPDLHRQQFVERVAMAERDGKCPRRMVIGTNTTS